MGKAVWVILCFDVIKDKLTMFMLFWPQNITYYVTTCDFVQPSMAHFDRKISEQVSVKYCNTLRHNNRRNHCSGVNVASLTLYYCVARSRLGMFVGHVESWVRLLAAHFIVTYIVIQTASKKELSYWPRVSPGFSLCPVSHTSWQTVSHSNR